MATDPFVERERIRKDLEDYPADLVDWEASCLKNVADLLDSLERARGEWGSLSARLHDAEERILDLSRDLEAANETGVELEDVRKRLAALAHDLDIVRRERDTLAENRQDLEMMRAELAEAREEIESLEATRDELAETRRRLADLEGAREGLEAVQAELDESRVALDHTRAELSDMRRQLSATRDQLADTREQLATTARERDTLRNGAGDSEELLARIEKLDAEREALRKECEENTVLVCDYRVRFNRLEQDRDDAVKEGKRKVKKILGRIHAALDEAGAPSGEDMSFGERVRRLKEQSLGMPLDIAGDFDEDDQPSF